MKTAVSVTSCSPVVVLMPETHCQKWSRSAPWSRAALRSLTWERKPLVFANRWLWFFGLSLLIQWVGDLVTCSISGIPAFWAPCGWKKLSSGNLESGVGSHEHGRGAKHVQVKAAGGSLHGNLHTYAAVLCCGILEPPLLNSWCEPDAGCWSNSQLSL